MGATAHFINTQENNKMEIMMFQSMTLSLFSENNNALPENIILINDFQKLFLNRIYI